MWFFCKVTDLFLYEASLRSGTGFISVYFWKCCAARLICLNGFRMKMVWYFIARLSFMCNQSSWPMNIQDYLMPKLD
ncbi:hypothetical protein S245_031128 [Arachis hypogaea]